MGEVCWDYGGCMICTFKAYSDKSPIQLSVANNYSTEFVYLIIYLIFKLFHCTKRGK